MRNLLRRPARYARSVAAGIWHGLVTGLREIDRNIQAGIDAL